MSRESFVFLIGFVVFFTHFLGVPRDWKEIIYLGAGVLLMLVGFSLRRSAFLRSIDDGSGERRAGAFVESGHTHTKPPSEREEM